MHVHAKYYDRCDQDFDYLVQREVQTDDEGDAEREFCEILRNEGWDDEGLERLGEIHITDEPIESEYMAIK